MTFKSIPGWPMYCVSRNGMVGSRKKGFQTLALCKNSHGYYYVNLSNQSVPLSIGVHNLVLLTYRGPRPKGMTCRHLNGVRTDNRLTNLAWGTWAEQVSDARKHGTRPPKSSRTRKPTYI